MSNGEGPVFVLIAAVKTAIKEYDKTGDHGDHKVLPE